MSVPSLTTAVILAGGAGTRIRQMYPDIPKPLIPIAGRPFLGWQIEWLRAQGVTEVILSIGYRAEQIVAYFAEHPVTGVRVRPVVETEPLGTGGAIRFAAQGISAPWAVICNGDSLCPAPLAEMRAVAGRSGCRAVVLGSVMPDASDYGTVESDAADRVTAFIEKGRRAGAGCVNAGVYLVDAAWARGFSGRVPLSVEREVFPAMAPGELLLCRTTAPFLDIGVPDRVVQAEKFFKRYFTL